MLSGLENPVHLLLVALIVLMVFGAKRVPEIGRSLGSGLREFRSGILGRDVLDGTTREPLGVQTEQPIDDQPPVGLAPPIRPDNGSQP